ncbi:MAG TPA: hypothetical protein VFV55_09475 [Usitatibacteraceae bacterium]|nr:hypothetical protein [Usitatibacteraceae bacterium]
MPVAPAGTAPESLRRHLERLREMRGREAHGHMSPRLAEVKAWQASRLARTYADLSANPRYAKATEFFLGDLYGAKDFSGRDEAMLRIYPVMVRTLPRGAVETASLAIEVDALSEELDRRVAACIEAGQVGEASYARAYRQAGTRAERMRQMELIGEVGRRLDALVVKPIFYLTLKLMRQPARIAGLEDLQTFLERGFEAFRHMAGADEFLATIASRETAILNRLFSGHPSPFSG